MGLVSVTFDNLGEAAEIEGGTWPQDRPAGEHFSVVEILPRLLERLDATGVRATFFVEGLNAEVNPRALARIREAGHEVACHAWRHESWSELGEDRERELLERCRDALGPAGFRPPGGHLTERTPALLRELGFAYASPAGERAGVLDGVPVLPFRWRLVDAYHLLPSFAGLRERHGDPSDPQPPTAVRDAFIAAIDGHDDGHLTLLFHPFLVSMGDEVLEVIGDVLEHAAAHAECVRMEEAAAQVSGTPRLDASSWM